MSRQRETCDFKSYYEIYPPKLNLSIIDSRCMISHKHKFAYFRIPKAANSTVTATLYYADTLKVVDSLDSIQQIKDTVFDKPSLMTNKQVSDFRTKYFKFTFVRNPFTRIVSAYLDKIKTKVNNKRSIVAKSLNIRIESEISFDLFLYYLENGGIYENGHWARQTDILTVNPSDIDYIAKIENIEKDLNYILKIIFSKVTPIINIREHATNAMEISKQLDDNFISRIFKLYEPDFQNFEYSPYL